MRAFSGIYVIKNTINSRCYVGSAIRVNARISQHLYDLRRGKHHSIKLQRFFDKNGESCLIFDVLEVVDDVSGLIEREQYYIDTLNPWYNCTPVAGSRFGSITSKEVREKISKSRRGFLVSEETKLKISKANLGKKYSDDIRKKISQKLKGVKRSDYIYEKFRKRIIQTHTKTGEIRYWSSVTEAASANGVSIGMISKVLRGERKTSKKCTWQYAE